MATRTYSVPFTTVTIDIYEVDATSGADATMKATTARLAGVEPMHSHIAKFTVETPKPTLHEGGTVGDGEG